MTAQTLVLFTFRVLLITRDATRYLQHKVHLPKSLTHAGTYGKALQVQTLSRAKRHSPPLQVLRTVTARICRTQRLRLAHVRKYTRWKPFQCHRLMYCVRAVLCHAISAVHCARFLAGYCTGRLAKTASRQEESEIIHRQRTAKSTSK